MGNHDGSYNNKYHAVCSPLISSLSLGQRGGLWLGTCSLRDPKERFALQGPGLAVHGATLLHECLCLFNGKNTSQKV